MPIKIPQTMYEAELEYVVARLLRVIVQERKGLVNHREVVQALCWAANTWGHRRLGALSDILANDHKAQRAASMQAQRDAEDERAREEAAYEAEHQRRLRAKQAEEEHGLSLLEQGL